MRGGLMMDEDAASIVAQIKTLLKQLRTKGATDKEIDSLLAVEEKPGRAYIDSKGMLVLPDAGGVQIKLTQWKGPYTSSSSDILMALTQMNFGDTGTNFAKSTVLRWFTMTRISSRMPWKVYATRRRSHGTQTYPGSRGRLRTCLAKEPPNSISSKEAKTICIGFTLQSGPMHD